MKHVDWKQRREDYALDRVPDSYRTWRWFSLVGVILSGSTAMFYLAYGGDLVGMYGTKNLIIGMIIATLGIGLIGFVFAVTASRVGLSIDLITSSCGMGYQGAGITSLIYAIAFILFFSIEASIISEAIHTYFASVPLGVIYVIVGLVFIPLAWYGMSTMSLVMWSTLPIYIALIAWSIYKVMHIGDAQGHFYAYKPEKLVHPAAGPALLQLVATMPAMIINGSVAADIGRFLTKKDRVVGAVGLGFLMNGLAFLGAATLGAWFSLKLHQSDPGVYFPSLIGGWGILFVVITQLRVNLLNVYSGSLAFSMFFSRIFNFSPGRHWWIILIIACATALMFANVLHHLTAILTFESVFIIAWIMSVISYIIFKRGLSRVSPENFPFKKGTIANFNPIGVVALCLALLAAVPMALGLYGPFGETLAPFVSGGVAFVFVPLVALVVK